MKRKMCFNSPDESPPQDLFTYPSQVYTCPLRAFRQPIQSQHLSIIT